MPTALVTGASRGLGLELTRQLAETGYRVVATARDPGRADGLQALADGHSRIDVARLDVTDAGSAAACAEHLGADDVHLDLLVNNAGVWDAGGAASRGPLGSLDADALVAVLRTNAVGALVVTQALAPRLASGAAVVNLSSGLGSLGRSVPRRNYGYALSKAALNMVTRCLAAELGDGAVTVV
jgi:NAD(P)-dependent dehydrogenase (short-subunit alcohol dehydrogenase family)